ncbi:leucine-rich repeat-containing protein 45-like isoform X2 [Macrobrachium rosenbergii]|uniref:leucine-rich repeat-containing protein 45-like isoform X2 n=1 Tax=Macrobrachium rosenbergii TaxID=79674 RepID=UPI0034D72CA3
MASPDEQYKQLCKKYNIEVQECVKDILKQVDILDFSNQTLSVGTCAVLGKIMQSSAVFTKGSFEDCLLEEDGIKSILFGLCGNTSIKTVSLKGNNIQGTATNALAKMLQHNVTIARLSLEWNNLGLCQESFAVFCESLGGSSTLEYLDLRSNQLGADAAASLARALMRNSSLLSLDIRWNCIGGAGGKALLESLRYNKTLTQLNLIGNNIPNDTLNSIDQKLNENSKSVAMTKEFTSRTEVLKQQLEQQERYSMHQIERLEQLVSKTDVALNKTIKESAFYTGQLEEELRSKKLEIESLQAKIELLNSALRLHQERASSLENQNGSLQEELQKSQEEAHAQSNKDREIGDLEFRCSSQKKHIIDLKETICSLQSEVKGARIECDELVAIETAKHKETLRNLDQQHNSELQRMRNDHQQVEAELRDRISNLDARRNEAEGEVSGLRVQISTDRTTAQAQLGAVRQQLKAEHASVMRGMEERLHAMEESRNDAEERLRVQIASNTSLTAANAKLNSQIHSLTNQLAELQAAIDGKALEVKAAESRVREEVKEQFEELKQEREQTAQLNSTVIKLQRTISEKQLEYDSNIRKLEDKLRLAKQEAKQREEELLKIREDEERRVGMLHSAFVSYFNTSPSSPTKTNQMK